MKVKDVKVGEIFRIDNTFVRPKLKLKEGFIDMATRYIWICREEVEAEILTDVQIATVTRMWGMPPEKFEEYKQRLIKKHIKEVQKCQEI